MSRFVFVTHELSPTVPGGAGAVLETLTASLAAAGHDVTVLLACDPGPVAPAGVEVVTVQPPRMDGTIGAFVERSRRLAVALAEMVAERPPDLVEFHDFDIPGWWALSHRAELGMAAIPLVIRLHGPVEAMTEAMGVAPPPMDLIGRLERQVFGMADGVVVPSPAMAEWARDRYELERDRIRVGPLPVPPVVPVSWEPGPEPEFVAFGRLHEVKGSHDLVEAAVRVLDRHPSASLRLIGGDGWSASTHQPMSEFLAELVPSRLADRIRFDGPMLRSDAMEAMRSAWAVVVPSRFETFCAAAHEARRSGLPVVVPDLPAFAGLLEGHGLLGYDGTVDGLASTLDAIAADISIARRLVAEPAPVTGDPMELYRMEPPPVRHERSQAGLGTAAVKDYEAWTTQEPGRLHRAARRLLRLVPYSMARIAVRLLPTRLKDRVRSFASWPAEQERRERIRRLDDLAEAVRRGRFGPVDDPLVSVVIPCFEQGQWVREAVASVHEQTEDSWEIVLVDDGSVDTATIEVLDELAQWPRITLVRQPNRGLPAARNAGIRKARGRYLVPLDADDEIAPEFLALMVAALDSAPDAGLAHCLARLFGDVDAIWVPRPANPYWQRLSNGIVGCVLLRRDVWEAVGGYDESMRAGHEDWDLWVRIEAMGWTSVRVDVPLFRYRKHGRSMSVDSEADFEGALSAMAARHPDLYDPVALRSLKDEHYPLLSVVVGPDDRPADVPDVEIVRMSRSIVAAVASATGKYVCDLTEAADRIPAALGLVEQLERSPAVAAAGDGEIAVWRRWSLLDPDAEPAGWLGEAVPGRFASGAFADPGWMVPEITDAEVPIMRQRPEEAGRIPGTLLT